MSLPTGLSMANWLAYCMHSLFWYLREAWRMPVPRATYDLQRFIYMPSSEYVNPTGHVKLPIFKLRGMVGLFKYGHIIYMYV